MPNDFYVKWQTIAGTPTGAMPDVGQIDRNRFVQAHKVPTDRRIRLITGRDQYLIYFSAHFFRAI